MDPDLMRQALPAGEDDTRKAEAASLWDAAPPGRNARYDGLHGNNGSTRARSGEAWRANERRAAECRNGDSRKDEGTFAPDMPASPHALHEDLARLSRALDEARAENALLKLRVRLLSADLAAHTFLPALEAYLCRLRSEIQRWLAALPLPGESGGPGTPGSPAADARLLERRRFGHDLAAIEFAVGRVRHCGMQAREMLAVSTRSSLAILAAELDREFPGSLAACEVRAMTRESSRDPSRQGG